MTPPLRSPLDATASRLLAQVAAVTGQEAALRLAGAYGGRRIYIPHAPQPEGRLARTIGLDAARRLAAAFGGITLQIPIRLGRRVRILQLRAEQLQRARQLRRSDPLSVARIAEQVGVTERFVWLTLQQYKSAAEAAFGAGYLPELRALQLGLPLEEEG